MLLTAQNFPHILQVSLWSSSGLRLSRIATNSRLAGNKSNWIDFNAGRIVTDDLPLEDAAKELFQLVLDVASGKKVKAEIAGFHDLAIFKQGVTL